MVSSLTSYFIETSNKPPPGIVEIFSWYISCVTAVCADRSATKPSMSAFLWNLRSPSLGTNFAAHWMRSRCRSAHISRCDSVNLLREQEKNWWLWKMQVKTCQMLLTNYLPPCPGNKRTDW
jgi:hypothetical protein